MTKNVHESLTGEVLVVGLGVTGLSCARFLAARGIPFVVADSRSNPPFVDEFRESFPASELHLGHFDPALFRSFEHLLLSPGVALDESAVQAARDAGAEVLGDIELFLRYIDAPLVAVTGSNGKSTVVCLLAEMGANAGIEVRMGGNIGTPALNLLAEGPPDLYLLELSSFQLELTESLNAQAAAVLNVSDDHLDRHGTIERYTTIKQGIYGGDGVMVINRDDPLVATMAQMSRRVIGYSLQRPAGPDEYGLDSYRGREHIVKGDEPLIAVDEIRLPGRHNLANAMAALALGEVAGLSVEAMCEALRSFPGLEHRCQWVAERDGVEFYNDSKGTNVGATLAALEGMPGRGVVIILGGECKGADFAPLRAPLSARARAVVTIGCDAPLLEEALQGCAPLYRATSMEQAVEQAVAVAERGDSVLLSPACASFDMFANYLKRGDAFISAVRGLR